MIDVSRSKIGEGVVIQGLLGAGLDARRLVAAKTALNVSVAALGSYAWTSLTPDVAPLSPTRRPPETWAAQISAGFTRHVSDVVSLSLGAAASHNFVVFGHVADWDPSYDANALVVGIGSLQRRGLRTLPLVRVHLSDWLTLDGHVAVAYVFASQAIVETYLAGVTALF
jgi:hypothetical protein